MLKNSLVALALASFTTVLLACSGGEVGEPCETEGSADECVEEAICGKPSDTSETPECLKICTQDADCGSSESCNGVTGTSVKACRIK
ncbi:hypothetical protein [Polyangium spumosum]|uniref:Lipoprotein n=1 Tax=Polyangium spumosum TaxID=889282 RepID=A0A6N7PEI5_9BACT|nr:hypothetical protein [Polyangium spumosum]MRG90472.1 hypothetical protein [Polyangium spumosum]